MRSAAGDCEATPPAGLKRCRASARTAWFRIGDRDLATHLHRTRLLRDGWTMAAIVRDIARAFGLETTLLPMSDDPVRTIVSTDSGDLPFQQYLVKHHAQPAVRGVRFEGAERAAPAPAVLEAIHGAEAIFIAPSNPLGSIEPILRVPGIREAIEASRAPRAAVSPIIGGVSLQPPAAEMMRGLGHDVSVAGVAAIYRGVIDTLIIDEDDASRADEVARHEVRCVIARTRMVDERSGHDLGIAALQAVGLTP